MIQQQFNELLYLLYSKKNHLEDIPKLVLDKSSERLIKIYAEGYKDTFITLLDAFEGMTPSTCVLTQQSLLIQLENKMKELNEGVARELINNIKGGFVEGWTVHALATETIRDIEKLGELVPFSLLNHHKLSHIASDTMEDLLFVTQHTTRETKKLVRDVVGKQLQLGVATAKNYDVLKTAIERELHPNRLKQRIEKEAFTGIIDKAGRRWNLQTYVNMVVNTKMHQAHVAGLQERALETGDDLARIPFRGTADACRNFEGLIISMTGNDMNFPSYDSLQGTGMIFHPNCQHSPIPIGDYELLPNSYKQEHEAVSENLKKI